MTYNTKSIIKDVNGKPVPQYYNRELDKYKVENGELIKYTNVELNELNKYGKLLNESERLLNSLKPNINEIKKAEMTIEILSLLQEVL